MDNQNTRNISIKTWHEVRDLTYKANKELASLIDATSPDETYKLVQIDYLFGDTPVDKGIIQIPTSTNQLLPITHSETSMEIKKELLYKNNPLFLILNKGCEAFIDTGQRVVPLNYYGKGSLCCTYEAMDFLMGTPSNYNWSFASGAKSIFMLPKLADRIGLKRLCAEFGISSSLIVKKPSDHWELFKYISQSPLFKQPWLNSILCFGKKWFDKKNDSKEWFNLKNFFIKQAWMQAHILISRGNFSMLWEKYAEAIILRRLKPKPYLFDQLKHLLSIARGDYPAFIPMNESQERAPSEDIQKAITEVYGLKDYLPTLMHSCSLKSLQKNQSFYYSLSFPTLLEGSPLKKDTASIMVDVREIKLLIETLNNSLTRQEGQENEMISNTTFEYYHTDRDNLSEIQPSTNIFKNDLRFQQTNKESQNRVPCNTSPFFKGCIKITPKHN